MLPGAFSNAKSVNLRRVLQTGNSVDCKDLSFSVPHYYGTMYKTSGVFQIIAENSLNTFELGR